MKKKYITILNVMACIAVVFIHTDEAFWTFSYEPYWVFANIVHCVLLFSVPIFFMISGCNLLDYRDKYSTKEFAEKRLEKTFIPFLGWSLIAIVLRLAVKEISFSELTVSSIVVGIFNTEYLGVYWFFIPLFAVYLCIPVLSLIPKDSRKKIFTYMIFMWLVFNCVAPFVFQMLQKPYNSYMNFPVVTGYLFYVVVGYYIDHYEIKKPFRCMVYLLGVAGLAVNIISTHVYSYQAGAVSGPVGDYLTVTTVACSIALFMAVRYMPAKAADFFYRFCEPVSRLTFGIYLTHAYFWLFIKHSGAVDCLNPVVVLAGGGISFAAAAVATAVMKRIPYMDKLVP